MDDKALLKHIRQGDKTALKQLYDNHIGYLRAVCSRYIPDDDEVKDILQDSFIRIFSAAGKFEDRGSNSLRAWMSRIVVNESLKRLRKKRKWKLLMSDGPVPDIPDTEQEEESFYGIPPEKLMEMIRSLPDGYRTVLNLYVFEDKSHKEIAEILGIGEGSSASQLHRAKAMMARMAKEYKTADE
ncbi:MAG: RNA polymerase sigma factor [Bacteroidales bacterium]|nr:RNA polymerase sigma factor [Bacteroides sp.]MCM1503174.1 RNA polymerase sigma factor [Bacteroidales bacterium]